MHKSISFFLNSVSILLMVFAISCTKETANNKSDDDKTKNQTITKLNPIEFKFSTQVVKNISPTTVTAKTPQLIFEDKTLVKSQGSKITLNKNSVTAFALKNLSSKIAKPKVVIAKPPIVINALPYKTRENNPFNIKYLDIEQGLLNATIHTIVEDKDGAIWFGSRLGLTKYDGKKLYHYNENKGLIFSHIKTLIIDHSGNIWIGTFGGGLSKFDGKTFTNYNLDAGLPSNTINTIFEDSKHTIWIGSEGGALCKLKDSTLTFYDHTNNLPPNVKAITEDKKGNIIIGSLDNGVYFIKDNFVTNFKEQNGLIDNSITTILIDKKENIWFGGDKKGISKFDGKEFTNFTESNGLTYNIITCLAEDINDNIWIGTYNAGISKYDGVSFHNFNIDQGLNSNVIESLCCAKNGIIWIGTAGSGIAKYSGDVFSHKTTKEGLSSDWIWNISQTKNNDFWFSTNGEGEILLKDKQLNAYTDKEGLNNNVVLSHIINKDGSHWFGSYENGACYFDGKEFKTINNTHGLLDNSIWTIVNDGNENVWFGTENGLAKYDGKNLINYFDSLNNITVFSSLLDKDKSIWFGTNGNGLLHYKNDTFYNITKSQGLIDDFISCILQDTSGNLWFGSQNGGVSRLKDGVFTNLSELNGLSNSSVLSIVNDNEGNIWFGTRAGINKLSQAKINLSKTELEASSELFKTYGVNEGFTGINCIRNSVCLDNEKNIWWGTTKMLTKYNPKADFADTIAPKVLINSIKLLSEDVNWNVILNNNQNDSTQNNYKGIKLDSTTAWNRLPVNLVLPYDKNHLTFDFIGIDFNSQEKINYQYMLEGADDNWSPIINATEADYRNIEPGDYIFKVKAGNKAGYWSNPIEFKFTINPPWWKTWWALTLWVLGIILIIFNYIKYRERVLRIRQQELEETVEDRTKEVVNQKEIVEKKQTEILDSINYAKRIQHSLLASDKLLNAHLIKNDHSADTSTDYFIVFKPKDIVSGDFYWASKLSNDHFVILAADSTGHGVPGAIMSILNIACLKEAISKGITRVDLLLNETRKLVIENLKNDGSDEGGKDGMDGSLLSFDFKNNIMYCASANNPIWIIRGNELIEIKADRMPIGKHDKDETPFTINTINIQKGDVVYALTDGFPDQFGGPKGKKFKLKQLQSLIVSISHEPMSIQKQKLNATFDAWRGDLEQVDDVCLIGIKI